eukprot:1152272-Pelagomonas_calceolata.AAC.6
MAHDERKLECSSSEFNGMCVVRTERGTLARASLIRQPAIHMIMDLEASMLHKSQDSFPKTLHVCTLKSSACAHTYPELSTPVDTSTAFEEEVQC